MTGHGAGGGRKSAGANARARAARGEPAGALGTGRPGTGGEVWGCTEIFVTKRRRPALQAVSVSAPAGQVTAVVGGDGAGKTTLLRCMAGSLAPDRGTIRRPESRRLGYLPASSGLYPDLTVAENLEFRGRAYGMTAAQLHDRAAGYLAKAGLTGAAGRLAGQLSGGMRQKLGVIAAMLHHPDLLVLDEPATGVDPVSRADLWWLIARAAADGCAVLLSTCYIDEAERCGSVLVLQSGRVLAAGTPDEIVAALPGAVHDLAERPAGAAAGRAWRRAGRWRVWEPDPDRAALAAAIAPDLQDAVTVAMLARQAGSEQAA